MPVVRNGAQDEDEGHLMMIGKMQQWSLSDPRGGLGCWMGRVWLLIIVELKAIEIEGAMIDR